MDGLSFLDLVIGLIFIYLIYSISCSAIWEIFVNLSALRGKMLRNWFLKVFNEKKDDVTLAEKMLNHPLIKSLSNTENKVPSYIPAELFSEVLLDVIVNDSSEDDAIKVPDKTSVKATLSETILLPKGLKSIFLQFLSESKDNLEEVKLKIARWYNNTQDRLIGAYKRRLQRWILIIALILVALTNADSLVLANYLYNNDETRTSLANQASEFLKDSVIIEKIDNIKSTVLNIEAGDSIAQDTITQQQIIARLDQNFEDLKILKSEVQESGMPLGWSIDNTDWSDPQEIAKKFCGLLLTAFAVSLGAPFWFDILNKLANLRSSGNRPEIQK